MSLASGPAKKVTVYLGEHVHHRGDALYHTILNYLFSQNVAGASVFKGIAGFGTHHHMHTKRILELSDNLPVKIEFIETAERVEALLPELLALIEAGLIEVQDTMVVRRAGA
jgi:PII-like signaling protein